MSGAVDTYFNGRRLVTPATLVRIADFGDVGAGVGGDENPGSGTVRRGSGSAWDAALNTNGALTNNNRTFTTSVLPGSTGSCDGFAAPASARNQVDIELFDLVDPTPANAILVALGTLNGVFSLAYANQGLLTVVGGAVSPSVVPPLVEGDVVTFLVDHTARTFVVKRNNAVVATGNYTSPAPLRVSVAFARLAGDIVQAYTGLPYYQLQLDYETWDSRFAIALSTAADNTTRTVDGSQPTADNT